MLQFKDGCISFLLLILSFIQLGARSQSGLKKGDAVPDIPVRKILNFKPVAIRFSDLEQEITILDFFGTWCGPCIKALPKLESIQGQFTGNVSVVLVSNEKETQLSKFINARPGFPFPVVVDVDNYFTGLFQPPSYPYTVIVNKQGRLLEITTAEALTSAAIQHWLTEAGKVPVTAGKIDKTETTSVSMTANQKSANTSVRLSQEFIYAAKTGDDASEFIKQLKSLDPERLMSSLSTDDEKKAFWVNLYNGFTQYLLKKDPGTYSDRKHFFKAQQIEVAGSRMSLDDIEHGILRRSKLKWSLGYLNKLFPAKREKGLRVKKLDYRIHFALNCGAKSCPPIAFYNNEIIDAQLKLATNAYLTSEAEYDKTAHVIHLPKLMSWFRGDFGGKKGMLKILKANNIIPADSSPKILYKDYDWNLYLENFKK